MRFIVDDAAAYPDICDVCGTSVPLAVRRHLDEGPRRTYCTKCAGCARSRPGERCDACNELYAKGLLR